MLVIFYLNVLGKIYGLLLYFLNDIVDKIDLSSTTDQPG